MVTSISLATCLFLDYDYVSRSAMALASLWQLFLTICKIPGVFDADLPHRTVDQLGKQYRISAKVSLRFYVIMQHSHVTS